MTPSQKADASNRARALLGFHFSGGLTDGLSDTEVSFSEPKALPGKRQCVEVIANIYKAEYRMRFTYLTGTDALAGQEILELTAE